MFIPGKCSYLAWKSVQGGLNTHTVYEHRKNLSNCILPNFGDLLPRGIGPVEVENWLRSLSLPGSSKNAIINTFNVVLTEAKRAKLISELPGFRRFTRRSMRCDILTSSERITLFPDNPSEIEGIWKANIIDTYGLMFGLMFRLILPVGLRPGEGRAIL